MNSKTIIVVTVAVSLAACLAFASIEVPESAGRLTTSSSSTVGSSTAQEQHPRGESTMDCLLKKLKPLGEQGKKLAQELVDDLNALKKKLPWKEAGMSSFANRWH